MLQTLIEQIVDLYDRIVGWISDHQRQVVYWYVWIFVALFAALTIHYLIKANQLL